MSSNEGCKMDFLPVFTGPSNSVRDKTSVLPSTAVHETEEAVKSVVEESDQEEPTKVGDKGKGNPESFRYLAKCESGIQAMGGSAKDSKSRQEESGRDSDEKEHYITQNHRAR